MSDIDKKIQDILQKVEMNTTDSVPPVDTPFAFSKTKKPKKPKLKNNYKYAPEDIRDKWAKKIENNLTDLTTENQKTKRQKVERLFDEISESLYHLEILLKKEKDKLELQKLKSKFEKMDGLVNTIGYQFIERKNEKNK